MIFIRLIFTVKNPLLGLVRQYARLADGYYKHRQAQPINEHNTFYVTGGKCSKMQISVEVM